MAPRVTVLGIGNVLMGDDGVGPHVVRVLETSYTFPPDVELVDAGTPGHDLSLYMEGRELLVVLDAVAAAGLPGDVRTYTGEEIRALPTTLRLSPHEPGLREALLKLDFSGGSPGRVVLVGVIPAVVDTGTEIGDVVRGALPLFEAEVLRQMETAGVVPLPKGGEAAPDRGWGTGRREAP